MNLTTQLYMNGLITCSKNLYIKYRTHTLKQGAYSFPFLHISEYAVFFWPLTHIWILKAFPLHNPNNLLFFVLYFQHGLYAQFLLKKCPNVINVSSSLSPPLRLSRFPGVVSRWGGNHGEAVAVRDAGSRHGGAGADLPEALRLSDPVAQPGNPLCQERPTVRTAQHWQAYSGAAAGWQLCHEVTVTSALYLLPPTSAFYCFCCH